MKNRFVVSLLSAVLAAPLVAQAPDPQPPQPRAPVQPEAQPERGRRPRGHALPATLLLRVVISDQIGTAEAQKKHLELRLAEGERFFLRANAVNTPATPRLNLDARAEVVGERAALQLTVDYAVSETGAGTGDDAQNRSTSTFKYQWAELVVELGKPTIVLQTSDPVANRRIALEVTLSVVRP
jgi:hypothetical protein